MGEVMTFGEFLQWVSTPAGLGAIGASVSMFLRSMDWFEDLSHQRKSIYIVLVCVVVLPLILVGIPSLLPESALNVLEWIFNLLSLGAVAYLGSQGAHELWNKRVVEGKATLIEGEEEDPLTGFGNVEHFESEFWKERPPQMDPGHLRTPSEGSP